jgi:hypothetical protein
MASGKGKMCTKHIREADMQGFLRHERKPFHM